MQKILPVILYMILDKNKYLSQVSYFQNKHNQNLIQQSNPEFRSNYI